MVLKPPAHAARTAELFRDLGLEYQQRFAALESYREAMRQMLVADCFQRYVSPHAALLDLGSGWGSSSGMARPGENSRWT
jgi:hypothetical protein